MSRQAFFAGGPFAHHHRNLVGPPLPALDLSPFEPQLLIQARRVWQERFRSEFRSVQVLTRFLHEVVGAGDPIDVYAGAVELVRDEVRHASLCASLCRAIGAQPVLPDPVELHDPPQFLAAELGERAMHTALTMLVVNETISTCLIADLRGRCETPAVRFVIDATLADEETHGNWGLAYARAALQRFPASTKPQWRQLVGSVLAPHRQFAATKRGTLADMPEPALAALGLSSPGRQAIVVDAALRGPVQSALELLDLVPP